MNTKAFIINSLKFKTAYQNMTIINNVPVKKLVEFRRLSERSQKTFAKNLTLPKKIKLDDDGGGNYWVRSTSGLSNAFMHNDNLKIQEKIDAVLSVYSSTELERTKTMYKRNLEILHNYTNFDFSTWRPSPKLQFLSKPKMTLTIKDVPVQIIPNYVFSYDINGVINIGAISFVTWLDGFRNGDLGIFSEALFEYLSLLYSGKYQIDPKYCLTVDTVTKEVVGYDQILSGEIPSLLIPTIDTLNKYLV